MISSKISFLKRSVGRVLNPEPEFTKRIRHRYTTFWRDDFQNNVALLPLMHTEDPISQWKASANWQRLLENKHNSRAFAEKMNCRVPELYWQGKDPGRLDFDGLPNRYVIRPAVGHSAKSVYLMEGNINMLDGGTYSKDEIKEALQKAAAGNPNVLFLCEEFLADERGTYRIPDDYKFYMFNGELACIQVINRFGPRQEGVKGTVRFYDEHWNAVKTIRKSAYAEGQLQPAPACLPEMISYAKKLSKEYQIFVRVDLYATQKGAVFGEFCPTPARGYGFTPFGNKLLVNMWDRYCKGLI